MQKKLATIRAGEHTFWICFSGYTYDYCMEGKPAAWLWASLLEGENIDFCELIFIDSLVVLCLYQNTWDSNTKPIQMSQNYMDMC